MGIFLRLHQTESEHTKPKLQPDPSVWRRILSNETERQHPDDGGEQAGHSHVQAILGFGETEIAMSVLMSGTVK